MTTPQNPDTNADNQPVTLDDLAALCATRRMTYAEARDYLDGRRVPPPNPEPLTPVSDAELDILEMRATSPFGLTKHEVRRVIHALKECRADNALRMRGKNERIGRLRYAVRHMIDRHITSAAAVAIGKEALADDDALAVGAPDSSAPEPQKVADLDALERAVEDICGDNDELMRAIILLKLEYKNGHAPSKFPFLGPSGVHYALSAFGVKTYAPVVKH